MVFGSVGVGAGAGVGYMQGPREPGSWDSPPSPPPVEAQPPTGDIPQERPHPEAPDLQKISLAKDWDMLGSSGNQELAGQQVPRL